MGDFDDVCVVTHPLAPASENATRTLLDIISSITHVSLVTMGLPEDSSLRDDHEVVELTSAGVGDSIPVAALRFLLNQLRMSWVLTKRDESTVLFFGAVSYLLPILVARLVGKTVILEPRGDVPLTLRLQWETRVPSAIANALAGIVWLLERIGYRLAHRIVTYTPAMAEQLDLETYEEKLYPYGARYVDIDRFRPQVPFEDREPVVGFLGRLDEEKGIHELAAVAQCLPDSLTFRFIGDGDLFDWLRSDLASEIEEGSVELTGWVDHEDVPQELSELQLLIMPSRPTEGLPTVILESLACGTPVYATPVSGVPDVVREGDTGFLMADLDPERIAAHVEDVYTNGDLPELSDNGRELIEQKYSLEAAIDRYKRILPATRG
ncbi:glycosyltransferase family 4 protein [Natrialbaceae archaeon A-gly3]